VNHLGYYAIQWIVNRHNGAVQRSDDFSQAGNLLADKVNTIVNVFSDAPHIEEVAKQALRKRNMIIDIVQGLALLIAPALPVAAEATLLGSEFMEIAEAAAGAAKALGLGTNLVVGIDVLASNLIKDLDNAKGYVLITH